MSREFVLTEALVPGVDQFCDAYRAGQPFPVNGAKIIALVRAFEDLGCKVDYVPGQPHDHPPLYRDPGCIVVRRP